MPFIFNTNHLTTHMLYGLLLFVIWYILCHGLVMLQQHCTQRQQYLAQMLWAVVELELGALTSQCARSQSVGKAKYFMLH